jgi:hypothetical protein
MYRSFSLNSKLPPQRIITIGFSQGAIVDATIPIIDAGKAVLVGLSFGADGSTGVAYSGLDASTDLTTTLLPPSVLTGPPNTAVGIDATTAFTWTDAPKTIYQVRFQATSIMGAAKVEYRIQTAANRAMIPSVPEVVLPKGQSFQWTVKGLGPFTSIDDAVSDDGTPDSATTLYPNLPFYTVSDSVTRTFTSAP